MTLETAERAPLVALVGRPNVGKSALFNRMTRRNRALVEDIPGTTRDRNYGVVEWSGRVFRLVDTGGLIESDIDPFSPLVRRGVQQAIEEADAILFVVDATTGPIAADFEIADMLRRAKRPVMLVANKTDTSAGRSGLPEFYSLGLGEAASVSAIHGQGVGDLLDVVLDHIPAIAPDDAEDPRIRVAIVGRPNVGKSSLTNAILGEERVLVSDVAGTTRDPIDTPFEFEGHQMLLVDTAGIRRRGRVERGVERHSVQRAEQSIDRADVVVVVLDYEEVLTAQDTHIAGYAAEAGKGMILVVNKWDLAEDRSGRADLVLAKQAPGGGWCAQPELLGGCTGQADPGLAKLLLADKVVVVARAAGAGLLADAAWGPQFAQAAAAALGKPVALIDVPAMSVSF